MKSESKYKHFVLAGCLVVTPLTALAGGGQAFQHQKLDGMPRAEAVRDWAAIDVNGDHFISGSEMEAYLIRQRAKQEAATGGDPRAELKQAERLYAQMMYTPAADGKSAESVINGTAAAQWNQVERLYWGAQSAEPSGQRTADAVERQESLSSPSQTIHQSFGSGRVLDSSDLGMYFKHGAGKDQRSTRVAIPGTAFTVEAASALNPQTANQPESLVELKPADGAQGG